MLARRQNETPVHRPRVHLAPTGRRLPGGLGYPRVGSGPFYLVCPDADPRRPCGWRSRLPSTGSLEGIGSKPHPRSSGSPESPRGPCGLETPILSPAHLPTDSESWTSSSPPKKRGC